jgi:hypothetical protein
MTDYTKSTNFATKDSLSSGNALKILKGTEIDTEFNNIQTAIATKADLTSPTFTGTPTLPTGTIAVTQSTSDSSTKVATTAFVQAALAAMYPVGSIYNNANVSTNPVSLLGFGTWEAFGTGRVLVGVDSGNALFDTVRETGGSADAVVVSHTHTATSTVTDPGHTHIIKMGGGGSSGPSENATSSNSSYTNIQSATTGITVATTTSAPAGSVSGTNANLPPYITVYMWRRTA